VVSERTIADQRRAKLGADRCFVQRRRQRGVVPRVLVAPGARLPDRRQPERADGALRGGDAALTSFTSVLVLRPLAR
jgi:hypothetical protein